MMLQAVGSAGASTPPIHAQPAETVAGSSGETALATSTPHDQTGALRDELRSVALRMRLEMPLKERIIHLQTFKFTFTGQQAVAFLQQQGLVGTPEAAADLCQRMLTQGLFKSIYHRDVFLPDGEVYRFSSSFPDGNKQKPKGIPSSITSTGLYKEIAKFGKTAAQPFKNIQLSLNDTLSSLGNLSIPAAKPGQLGGLGLGLGPAGSRPRSGGGGAAGRAAQRRSQAGKQYGAMYHHMHADSAHAVPDSASSLAALVHSLEALQANVQESTSLIRLDLQQHTALQEHLVGLLVAQQDSTRFTQLLIAINATAALLLLGLSATWTATVVAGCLLLVLLLSVGPEALGRLRQLPSSSEGLLLQRRSTLGPVGRMEPQLSRMSRQPGAAPAGAAAAAGVLGGYAAEQDRMSDRESVVVDDLEELVPYSEDFEDWPDAPVMLCPDPAATHQEFEVESPGPCHALPLNGDPIPFESELFRGVVAVHIRHLPTTPHSLFKGKKRLTWVALQGTFKRPISMDHLVYGMEFHHQLCNLPAPWFLENMLLPLARKISPSLRVGTLDEPFFFTPLITASQVVNVALPGQQPPLMEAKEDTQLLQQELGSKAGDGLTVSSRRRYFQAASNRAMPFSPDYVWTFHLWQEYIDFASYMLNMGYSSYDLTQHLDGQPLQVMAKDESTGQQLISLQVWHANLVRCFPHRLPRVARQQRESRISTASHEEALQDCGVQLTPGGLEGDTPAAASPAATTARHTPEQQLTPHTQQQQQQQSPRFASADGAPQLQQELSLQQQQHEQQQQRQLAHAASDRKPASNRQLQLLQQLLPHATHSDSFLPRPSVLAAGAPRDSTGSSSDVDSATAAATSTLQQQQQLRGAAVGQPPLAPPTGLQLLAVRPMLLQQQQQQQQVEVPSSSLGHHGSQGHLAGNTSAVGGGLPSAAAGGSRGGSTAGDAGVPPRGTALGSSTAGGSTAAVLATEGRSHSWSSAPRGPSDSSCGRSARVSTATTAGGDVQSSEGVDSPRASWTPTRQRGAAAAAAGAAAGAAAAGALRPQQQQQQPQLQQSSSKKKQKEQRDKEEQQRHQLHGLSVMGAL